MHIQVRDKRTDIEEWLPLPVVAKLMQLDADEIEAALEEYGECESTDYIALQPE